MHLAPTPQCRGAIQAYFSQLDENADSTLNRVIRSEFALLLLYRLRMLLCRNWRRWKFWFLARDRIRQHLIVLGDPEPAHDGLGIAAIFGSGAGPLGLSAIVRGTRHREQNKLGACWFQERNHDLEGLPTGVRVRTY